MSLLRLLGHWLIMACWLFINVAIRLVIMGEVFTIGLLIPFGRHIGLTTSAHGVEVVFNGWHRALFLFIPPFANAVFGLMFSLQLGRSRRRGVSFPGWDLAFLAFFCNFCLFIAMAALWSESVIAEPFYALLAAVVLSGVTVGVGSAFASFPFTEPPKRE